ncbi:glycoside hydrolase/deacetylase [Phellopilus nigrolimitatus]|nr:glycoside hydrolase/deacetylase [Phellopilus nigrolimitatus]
MKLVVLAAAAAQLPLLAIACADHDRYFYARQAASSSAAAVSGASSAAPASSAASLPPQVSVSLLSQNPTAVPLSSIIPNQATTATIPLATTFAPGATPSGISGAPPLPDISSLNAANYPPMDKAPPTDSPEVQQWIQEVASTGISIPNISHALPTAAAAADQSRCWWTCGGCTRETDVTTCPQKLTWGLTYDDGPAFYTPNLLDYLDQQSLKSTFFTIGSRILENPRILQTEYMTSHQIGVHTWSHPPLTTVSTEGIIAEFGWTKKIIKDILGVTPNTFRPPYGDIDDRVRAIATAMGLTPVMWTRISASATFDTGDFNINGGTISSSEVIQNFNQILGNASTIDTGFIVLEHDLFQETVELATGYIIPEALAFQPKLTVEPVITCQNKPLSDAYIETNNNSTNPPASVSECR